MAKFKSMEAQRFLVYFDHHNIVLNKGKKGEIKKKNLSYKRNDQISRWRLEKLPQNTAKGWQNVVKEMNRKEKIW